MRLGVVIACVFAAGLSTAMVVWLVSPPRIETVKEKVVKEAEAPLPVSATAPWPKAVMDKADFDFGRMEVGEERSHVFTIRNEGDAPLLIKQGPTTCQCTVSNVEKDQVAVGDSATITLKWKPAAQAEHFGKGADIYTNDPENRLIHLRILGMVAPRLVTYPERTWESPDVIEGQPAVFTGTIGSPIADTFQITALECRDPLLSAEVLPVNPDDLHAKSMRSGYRIRTTVSPDVPIGGFTLPLTIKTDLPSRTANGELGPAMEVEVLVTGHRRGPIIIVGGPEWDEGSMAILMGSFDANTGKKVSLTLFVRGDGADSFQLTEPSTGVPEDLRVTLERDEKSKGKQVRFQLSVEYPAGARPVSYRRENPGKIRLRTNLPTAPEIDLSVFLAAF